MLEQPDDSLSNQLLDHVALVHHHGNLRAYLATIQATVWQIKDINLEFDVWSKPRADWRPTVEAQPWVVEHLHMADMALTAMTTHQSPAADAPPLKQVEACILPVMSGSHNTFKLSGIYHRVADELSRAKTRLGSFV